VYLLTKIFLFLLASFSDQWWYRTSLGLLRDPLQSFQVNGRALSQSERLDWNVSQPLCCCVLVLSLISNTHNILRCRWVAIYMFIGAVTDLNRVIVLCTRFTDEIFSFLISLIFIINAIGSPFSDVGVIHYFDMNHKAHDAYEDQPLYSHWASALLSLIVFIGTTQGKLRMLLSFSTLIQLVYCTFSYNSLSLYVSSVAFLLRKFKFSPFLPSQAWRNTMTDFAVVISILIWSVIGNSFSEIPIEKLNVPSKFAPTFQCCDASCTTSWPNDCYGQTDPFGPRPWVVNLSDLNGKTWVPFMAAGPALLAFVLVFLDDGITWHLINHPSHKLNHGDAYNVSNFSSLFVVCDTYRVFGPLYIAHLCKSNYS